MPAMTARGPKVVIVGAGLGGLAAERALRRVSVGVTVVDAHNYATFAPLLFEAAVGVIMPEDVARPVRSFLGRRGHTTFRLGEVVALDWEGMHVELADGEELLFDYLVLAPGVVPWYGAVPGAAEHAVPLKTVTDAARIRNSILRSFEAAAAHPDRAGPEATTVAIVGGGASGVELAGYLADVLWLSFARDYPEIPRERMRLILVELGDRLLPGFDRRLSRYAEAALRRRGVDVRLHIRVERIDAGAIVFDGGERIRASTIVWAGGVSVPAWLTGARLASERLIAGRPTRPFRYFDKGTMAMVGVYAAVVQSGRLRLTGRLAWVAWGLLHVAYLPGMANRLRALQTWRWWHVSHEASARADRRPRRARTGSRGARGPNRVMTDRTASVTAGDRHPAPPVGRIWNAGAAMR